MVIGHDRFTLRVLAHLRSMIEIERCDCKVCKPAIKMFIRNTLFKIESGEVFLNAKYIHDDKLSACDMAYQIFNEDFNKCRVRIISKTLLATTGVDTNKVPDAETINLARKELKDCQSYTSTYMVH